jgi:hypothetical protein
LLLQRGEPEIEELDQLAAIGGVHEEDVLGLHVTVDDPGAVGGAEPLRDAGRDPHRARRAQRARERERVGEIQADEQLHREEAAPLAGALDAVHLEHVGVPDARGRGCLTLEPRDERGVGLVLDPQHLERDPRGRADGSRAAIRGYGLGQINVAGAAAAEQLDDPVAAGSDRPHERFGEGSRRHEGASVAGAPARVRAEPAFMVRPRVPALR